jgi:hypothetical protein
MWTRISNEIAQSKTKTVIKHESRRKDTSLSWKCKYRIDIEIRRQTKKSFQTVDLAWIASNHEGSIVFLPSEEKKLKSISEFWKRFESNEKEKENIAKRHCQLES